MSAKYTFLAWDTPIENAPLKLALLQLANNADDDGFSFYSISKMAISCGMSEKTFQRKIADMEKMGILTVERRSNRPSLYTLSGDEMGVSLCRLQNSEATESLQGGTESRLVGDRESLVLNSTPNTSPNKGNLSAITEGFEYWWSEYPASRRINKKGCLSKFKVLCKGFNDEQIEEFVNKLCFDVKQKVKAAKDIHFMVTTMPYLNQERYNDE